MRTFRAAFAAAFIVGLVSTFAQAEPGEFYPSTARLQFDVSKLPPFMSGMPLPPSLLELELSLDGNGNHSYRTEVDRIIGDEFSGQEYTAYSVAASIFDPSFGQLVLDDARMNFSVTKTLKRTTRTIYPDGEIEDQTTVLSEERGDYFDNTVSINALGNITLLSGPATAVLPEPAALATLPFLLAALLRRQSFRLA